jgi:hypothetical protein
MPEAAGQPPVIPPRHPTTPRSQATSREFSGQATLLVVEDVSVQAHVKNSDQAVGPLAERLTVGLAPSSELVAIAPRSRRLGQRTKGPTGHRRRRAGGCGRSGPGRPGCDRTLCSLVTCRRSSCEIWSLKTESGITELAQHPGHRGPRTVASPGRERTTLASGCCSKCSESGALSSSIWALKVTTSASADRVTRPWSPNANSTHIPREFTRTCAIALDDVARTSRLPPGTYLLHR